MSVVFSVVISSISNNNIPEKTTHNNPPIILYNVFFSFSFFLKSINKIMDVITNNTIVIYPNI